MKRTRRSPTSSLPGPAREIIVEPLEVPIERPEPARTPAEEPEPAPAPEREPAREPEPARP